VVFHDPFLWRGLATIYPLSPLRELVANSFGGGTPSTAIPQYWSGGIPWVSPKDFGEFDIDDAEDHISEEGLKAANLTLASPGSILIVVRSGILKHSIPVALNSRPVAVNQDVKVLVTKSTCEPRYLAWYLNVFQEHLLPLITKHSTTVQSINTSEFDELMIPTPPISKQRNLINSMDISRAERHARLAEADALLAGLDGFLLSTLGLNLPAKDDRKVFAASLGEARQQSHLNANYFHPERILALRTIDTAFQSMPYSRLSDVVAFIRDQIKTPGSNYLSLAHVQSNTGEIVSADEEASGTCSVFQSGDVLFARLRPYLNKVYRAEMDGCCSPEFHVLRVNNLQNLLPDYLAAVLRSSLTLAQTRHMMTGNTHPRLTNEDVINLVIPIPKDIVVQEIIVAEVHRRRDEARRLRAEAEIRWQSAKRWFEEQLLSFDQP